MCRLIALVGVLAFVLLGCGTDPGYGQVAELDLAEADRIEIRRGGSAWPTPGRLQAWEDADVVAEVTDAETVEGLVDELAHAQFIDTGAVDHDMMPPDYQVGFLRGDDLLERLGYYEHVSRWGEHEVEGRWVTDMWELLAVTVELPLDRD